MKLLPLLLLAGLYPAVPERQAIPKLAVSGDIVKPQSFTNAELEKSFGKAVQDVSFTLKGEPGHARAIPLTALLDASGIKVDANRKNGALSFVVVASAADGYTVTFSVGELSPNLGKREVWLALDWNGKPLAEADGPVRLIVTGDEKPSRWVHGVRSLKIVNLLPKDAPLPSGG